MTLQPARLLVALIAAIALPVFAQNLAVVNGKKIPSSAADVIVKQAATQGQKDTPELRKMIKDQLITQELLYQEAAKQGYTKKADIQQQIEQVRQTIVIRAMLGDHFKKNPISDKEIQAEYDKYKVLAANEKEYNARHILVEKEEEAKAIIAKLKAGGKFEELAKGTKDTQSAANGGSLDWSSASNYVAEFGDALKKLEKGAMTDTPVKTVHGYHVIRLDDVRSVKPKSLEELKPQISQGMQQKKFEEFKDALKKKAKIEG